MIHPPKLHQSRQGQRDDDATEQAGQDMGKANLDPVLIIGPDGAPEAHRAYFAGVSLGRHKGVTKVSPNKSVEGYIGGFVSGVVLAILYGIAASKIAGAGVDLFPLALCGLFGALATEIGDLAFSFIKRQYGVKDYGHLLPGHGGIPPPPASV